MENIIQKIQKAAAANGLQLNISGDAKTRVFYGKISPKPYKIISAANSAYLFTSLCNHLLQTKCERGKKFFNEGDYQVGIQDQVNMYKIICVYKIK